MATKAEQIRNLVKAFGGVPRESTIEDAIEDLLDNLPFGVKTEMVKIVPEQSLTGTYIDEGANAQYYMTNFNFDHNGKPFEHGKTYYIHINDKIYETVAEDVSEFEFSSEVNLLIDGENGLRGILDNGSIWRYDTSWPSELGETITLAIYEEQEVAKQLDPRFIAGGTTVIYSANYAKPYLFKDFNCENGYTKDELVSLLEKGANIVFIYSDAGKFQYYSNQVYAYVDAVYPKDYLEVCVGKNGDNTEYYYTSEYEESGEA